MPSETTFADRLSELDPHPALALSSRDEQARDALLTCLVASDPARDLVAHRLEHRRVPRRARRAVFAGLSVAAAGAACVLVVSATAQAPHADYALGGPVSLASWTKTPSHATATAEDQAACASELYKTTYDPHAMTTLAVDRRGDFTSFVLTYRGVPSYCVLLDGEVTAVDTMAASNDIGAAISVLAGSGAIISSVGFAQLFAPPATDPDGEGMAIADGLASPDVTAITLNFASTGMTVEATVSDGYWTAWWPQKVDPLPAGISPTNPADGSPVFVTKLGALDATSVTYTTTDGTIHDMPLPK